MENVTVGWCVLIVLSCVIGGIDSSRKPCQYTPTKVKGTKAPSGPICKGQLLLDERFTDFDRDLWQHEITLGGGGVSVCVWMRTIWLKIAAIEFQMQSNWFRIGNSNGMSTTRKIHMCTMESCSSRHHWHRTKSEKMLCRMHTSSWTRNWWCFHLFFLFYLIFISFLFVCMFYRCTNDQWFGCERHGTDTNIINPVRSARLNTAESFSFIYGRLELIAKLPTGDWLWPGKTFRDLSLRLVWLWSLLCACVCDSLCTYIGADHVTPTPIEFNAMQFNSIQSNLRPCLDIISTDKSCRAYLYFVSSSLYPAVWLLPTDNVYGGWPRSGEIDFLEGRGNTQYVNDNGEHIGVEHMGSTIHFGPNWDQNGYSTALFATRSKAGFNNGFHRFMMEWSPNCILFCIDGNQVGRVNVDNGFWERGQFRGENIWANASHSAPFDQYVSFNDEQNNGQIFIYLWNFVSFCFVF